MLAACGRDKPLSTCRALLAARVVLVGETDAGSGEAAGTLVAGGAGRPCAEGAAAAGRVLVRAARVLVAGAWAAVRARARAAYGPVEGSLVAGAGACAAAFGLAEGSLVDGAGAAEGLARWLSLGWAPLSLEPRQLASSSPGGSCL